MDHGCPFAGIADSFSHVIIQKRRYGASTSSRGQSGMYAYIDTRIPVRIDYLFKVSIVDGTGKDHVSQLALVRRLMRDPQVDAFHFPWALQYVSRSFSAYAVFLICPRQCNRSWR